MTHQSTNGKQPRQRRVKVQVTKEHIIRGLESDSGYCLVAEAVRDALKAEGLRPAFISVDLQTIRYTDMQKRERHTFLTPRSAQEALVHFDQGEYNEPFVFMLSRRNSSVTLAGKGDAAARLRRSRNESEPGNKRSHKAGAYLKANGTRMTRTGGKTPPIGALGRVRQFGIRALRA